MVSLFLPRPVATSSTHQLKNPTPYTQNPTLATNIAPHPKQPQKSTNHPHKNHPTSKSPNLITPLKTYQTTSKNTELIKSPKISTQTENNLITKKQQARKDNIYENTANPNIPNI